MAKLLPLLLLLLTNLLRPFSATAQLQPQERLDFPIDAQAVAAGAVPYYSAVLTPALLPCPSGGVISPALPASGPAAFALLKFLDSGLIWDNRGTESYHVFLSHHVYAVHQDIAFFTRERLLSLAYINSAMPDCGAQPSSAPGSFTMTGSFFLGIPSCAFSIDYRDSPTPVSRLDLGLRRPSLTLLQRNTDFGKIMGARTSASSYSATTHHALRPGLTLVSTYTLAFLYNLPPFDGPGTLRKSSNQGTLRLAAALDSLPP